MRRTGERLGRGVCAECLKIRRASPEHSRSSRWRQSTPVARLPFLLSFPLSTHQSLGAQCYRHGRSRSKVYANSPRRARA